jgi:excinuclease ABC subunit A
LPADSIELRGVCVHNLKEVDLDIPHRKLVVICGVSGSGKTSLALDTLYAEGQRRYIESFSAYTRQFLERPQKPDAERIDGIPPAIAVTHHTPPRSNRSTVGTATESADYLRLLYAKIGKTFCYSCNRKVERDSPASAAEKLNSLAERTRFMVAFQVKPPEELEIETETKAKDANEDFESESQNDEADETELNDNELNDNDPDNPDPETQSSSSVSDGSSSASSNGSANGSGRNEAALLREQLVELKGQGFVRAIVGTATINLADSLPAEKDIKGDVYIVVDRLASGDASQKRLRDSLETAFEMGRGTSFAFVDASAKTSENSNDSESSNDSENSEAPENRERGSRGRRILEVDGRQWRRLPFNRALHCEDCELTFPVPEPRLFSFNSPLGACSECEGFGNIIDIDMDLVVPDTSKTLRDGAIAPWNTPAYKHELKELLAVARDYDLPADIPYRDLEQKHLDLIRDGVPEREFGGLNGFFAWLERRKYKMHLRVFLSRWRSYRLCPKCRGARLSPAALSCQIGGKNIANISAMKIDEAIDFFQSLELTEWETEVSRIILRQVRDRLSYLHQVGVGYLSLDRTLRTLSGGEAQRVALTSTLGSNLVNMLYVLDEPTIGLHPADVDRLVTAICGLRDRGNSVVVVEHEEAMLKAADHLIEIGPGAGQVGGQVMFEGTLQEMIDSEESRTGDYIAGRRGVSLPEKRRLTNHGRVRLTGARGNNLKNITVEFPLGVLCVVAGVSGAGKSTLVQDTLYGAVCRRKRKDTQKPHPYDDVFGDGQIDDVVLVDQSPIGRSPRSNPVTYIKAFDQIRAVFADTIEARTHNYTSGHFSFNVDGGRCAKCEGDGYRPIDMQFLADVFMKCDECKGTRYRNEILDVTYRGRNIAEVLDMTVREAHLFFRGQNKVQNKLQRLIDVGLDYLRLGQPANTLSAGEAQRLKLAAYLSTASRNRTLFILDEPTTGLHFKDVVQLLDCFEALLSVGHSLIVVEHNLQLMKAADHIIDMGPGAAEEGGQIVAQGTPEEVAKDPNSLTGKFLAEALQSEIKLT